MEKTADEMFEEVGYKRIYEDYFIVLYIDKYNIVNDIIMITKPTRNNSECRVVHIASNYKGGRCISIKASCISSCLKVMEEIVAKRKDGNDYTEHGQSYLDKHYLRFLNNLNLGYSIKV